MSESSAGIPSTHTGERMVPRGYALACWAPGMLAWLIFALSLACAMWAHVWDAHSVDEHVRATAFVLLFVSGAGLVVSVVKKRGDLAFLRTALLVEASVVRRGAPDGDGNMIIVLAHGHHHVRTWTVSTAIESMPMLVARDGRHAPVLVDDLAVSVEKERVLPHGFTASDWEFFALYLVPVTLALAAALLRA